MSLSVSLRSKRRFPQSATASSLSQPLPEAAIRAYLDGLRVGNVNATLSGGEFAVVEGYTFVTFPMLKEPFVTSTRSSGVSTVRTRRIVLYVRALQ